MSMPMQMSVFFPRGFLVLDPPQLPQQRQQQKQQPQTRKAKAKTSPRHSTTMIPAHHEVNWTGRV